MKNQIYSDIAYSGRHSQPIQQRTQVRDDDRPLPALQKRQSQGQSSQQQYEETYHAKKPEQFHPEQRE
jgi:hypothetical protein